MLPVLTAILVGILLINVTAVGSMAAINIVSVVFIGIKAINYAIGYPVRESLYIPTVKDIKFKTKSWIDAFGSKIAKACASQFNLISPSISSAHPVFFSIVLTLWFFTAYLLGNRFRRAVAHNEVIGENA